MSRSKQPKRIKVWVSEYERGVGDYRTHNNSRAARRNVVRLPRVVRRVAVPLIELRRGEVVVDVEALVKVFLEFWTEEPHHSVRVHGSDSLRAALKKVGVR